MPANEIYILSASDAPALDCLIARCAGAAEGGNEAESRAYLTGIFEVLASEQSARESMRLSA